jgi:hypothetical protein
MNEPYFEKLAGYTRTLLDQLPIEREVQPLDYAINKLSQAFKERRERETEKIRTLWYYTPLKERELPLFTGLNTAGLLADRFTILLIKEWCLRNKHNEPQKADALTLTQTRDIIKALAHCRQGNSSVNSKITGVSTDVTADDWEDAFYQLLAINMVLWESQEILYIKDISVLPADELRSYIQWFSRGNMERNVMIELAEVRFWEKVTTEG